MNDHPPYRLRAVVACPVCRGEGGDIIARRSDGIEVVRCDQCKAGYTAQVLVDLSDYYDDGYFSRGPELAGTAGYSCYEQDFSPSSFLWIVSLVRALEQAPGPWLEIGAATGTLMELAQAWGYSIQGVELNASAAIRARSRGLDVREGLFQSRSWPAKSFRIISALEVLEHVGDAHAFLREVENILAVDGLFVFLVPNVPQALVDEYGSELLDFRKSLEHTVYFEERSLTKLIESVFGPGSLSLATFDVGSGSASASYAFGLVRRPDPKEERVRLLAAALNRQDVPLDGQSAAAAAVTFAKFGQQDMAAHWLERAASTEVDHRVLTLSRAQVARSAGESIASIRILDAHLKGTALGKDPIAAGLLQDALVDLMSTLCGGQKSLPELAEDIYSRIVNPGVNGATALRERVASLAENLEAAVADLALADQLRERDAQLREHSARLKERDAQLVEQGSRLTEYVAKLEERDAQLTEYVAKLEERDAQLDDYWRQIQELLDSTAWRVTRPVRAIGDASRRLRAMKGALDHVDSRRAREGLRLIAKGDFRTLERRIRALSGSPIVEPRSTDIVELNHEVWPADRPLVSVVIPCFNYGPFVRDAIESVLNQTWTDLEVVVVDAGSTDLATRERVRTLPERYGPKVRTLLLPERTLVGAARNSGLREARGKYVCCLDADDMLEPNYLELALFLLERYHYDIVSTAIQMFGDKAERVGILPVPTLEDMLQGNHIVTAAVVRRSLWEVAGGYIDTGLGKQHIYEDWYLWVRIMALGARATNLWRYPLFRYRVHSTTSLSQHPEIPDLARQRAAIAQANDDVITDLSIATSKAEARTQYRVANAFDNLLGRQDVAPDRVILLAMPFLLLGGAERLLSRIVSRLQERGWHFIVVTTLPTEAEWGDTSDWFTTSGAAVYHLPRLLDEEQWFDFVDYLIDAKAVDVLWMCGSTWAYAALPSLKQRHPYLRVADQLFNLVGHTRDNRRMSPYIDLHFVEDPGIREWLLEQGELPERIAVIENGVEVDTFTPISADSTDSTDSVSIGYCGRLADEKDPLFFIDLAASLRRRDNLRFLIAGAGPLAGEVEKRIARHHLTKKVHLLGSIADQAELRAYLAGLDLLVLPSRLDGRPNAVMEAQACGVPVVASAVGAIPQLILDGESGLLCSPGNLDEFQHAVLRLVDDAPLRQAMATTARKHAIRSLNAATMYDKYESSLTTLLKSRVD